jgi:hypothetical protein
MPAKRKPKVPAPESEDEDDVLHFTPAAYNEDLLDVNFAPLADGDLKHVTEPEGDVDASEIAESVDASEVAESIEADDRGDYNDEEVTETVTETVEGDTVELRREDTEDEEEIEEDIDVTPTVVYRPKPSRKKPQAQYTGAPLEPESSSSEDEDGASEPSTKNNGNVQDVGLGVNSI